MKLEGQSRVLMEMKVIFVGLSDESITKPRHHPKGAPPNLLGLPFIGNAVIEPRSVSRNDATQDVVVPPPRAWSNRGSAGQGLLP